MNTRVGSRRPVRSRENTLPEGNGAVPCCRAVLEQLAQSRMTGTDVSSVSSDKAAQSDGAFP
jgi:hypothetical protein